MSKGKPAKGAATGRREHLEEKKAIIQARLKAIDAELKTLKK